MIGLKKDEKLIQAGTVALRAPNGKPLPAVPQYMIVTVDRADPARVVELKENERIMFGGEILNDKKRAEERFTAIKAGQTPPPKEPKTPLYFIEDAENINPKTGRTAEGDKVIESLTKMFTEAYAIYRRKEKSQERQYKNKKGQAND